MIRKCDFTKCTRAGTCRAPKDRNLGEYYYFCKEHAAEYNKNWNYYAGMSPEEINEDWERDTFGYASKDAASAKIDTIEYMKFLDDFINGRTPKRKSSTAMPSKTLKAFKALDLPVTTTWREVQAQYRKLAKLCHPDTAKAMNKKSADETFATLSSSYTVLQKHFKK